MDEHGTSQRPAPPEPAEIVVYWRRGCPFCRRLLRWIDRTGVPTTRRDIWHDPDAAAELRKLTGGDETVPTVTIAGQALINPSPRRLRAAILAHAPTLLPRTPSAGDEGAPRGVLRRLRGG